MQNNVGCTLNLSREDMKQVTKHWVNSNGQWPRRNKNFEVKETQTNLPRAILGSGSLQQHADANINPLQLPSTSNINPSKSAQRPAINNDLSPLLQPDYTKKYVDIAPQIAKPRVMIKPTKTPSQPKPQSSVQNKSATLGATLAKRPAESSKSIVQRPQSSKSSDMVVKRSEDMTSQYHAEVVRLVREIQPEMRVSAQDVTLLQKHVDKFVYHVVSLAQQVALNEDRKMIGASDVDEAFCTTIAKLSPHEFTSPLACHVLRAEVGVAYSQGVVHDILEGLTRPLSERVEQAMATAVLNFLCIVVPRAAELDVEAALNSFWASVP